MVEKRVGSVVTSRLVRGFQDRIGRKNLRHVPSDVRFISGRNYWAAVREHGDREESNLRK